MSETYIEDDVEITITYDRTFTKNGVPGAAFGFPCDKNGVVDVASLNPLAAENYRKCINGEHDVTDAGVDRYVYRQRLCPCGSKKHFEQVSDARGIFIANVCDDCRAERLKGYRPEVLTNPDYECEEEIDEDY